MLEAPITCDAEASSRFPVVVIGGFASFRAKPRFLRFPSFLANPRFFDFSSFLSKPRARAGLEPRRPSGHVDCPRLKSRNVVDRRFPVRWTLIFFLFPILKGGSCPVSGYLVGELSRQMMVDIEGQV